MKQYDTYKDSGIEWIGNIPEHWEVKKLKHFAKVNGRIGFRGYTTDDLVSEGEGAYTIGGKHIANCVLDLSSPDFISWEKYYESPEIMVKKGDILMAQRGSLGKVAIVRDEIKEATINPSLVLINDISIYNIYLYYFLISKSTISYIELINTATAVPMISQNQIENISTPVPPLPEQEKIAEYLDYKVGQIDALIADKEAQVNDLQKYRQSLISETVTRGLNPNAPLKDSGIEWIGEIPEHWGVKRLKYCAIIKTGSTPPTSEDAYFDSKDYPWITPSDFNVNSIEISSTARHIAQKAVDDAIVCLYPPKSCFIIGIGGTLGRIGIFEDKCYTNQQINAIIPNKNTHYRFIAYCLSSKSSYIWACANTSTMPILNQEATKNLQLPIPPLAEQEEIAQFLDNKTAQIAEILSDLQTQIADLKAYKTALISEAVTGKIDLREWSTHEN